MAWSLIYVAILVAALTLAGPAAGGWSRKWTDYLGVGLGVAALLGLAIRFDLAPYAWGLVALIPLSLAGARSLTDPTPTVLASAAMVAVGASHSPEGATFTATYAAGMSGLIMLGLSWLGHRTSTALLTGAVVVPLAALVNQSAIAAVGFRGSHVAIIALLTAAVLLALESYFSARSASLSSEPERVQADPSLAPFPLRRGIILLIWVIASWVLSLVYFRETAYAFAITAGFALAIIATLLDLRKPGLLVLAGVVGIGFGSLLFKQGAIAYLGLTGLAGLIALLTLRRPSAVLALAPMLGLYLLQFWRFEHPYLTRFFNIGAIYGVIGLTLGALSAYALVEWARDYQTRCAAARIAGVLAGTLALGIVAILPISLNDEGIVGFVIGAALCATWCRPGPRASLAALGWSLGSVIFLAALVDPLYNQTMLTRSEKIATLQVPVLVLLALGFGAALLASRSRLLTPEEAA